jgi:hypothetical protein
LTDHGRSVVEGSDAETLTAMRCGVLRSGLASELWTRSCVDANVAAGRWARPAHDVVVLHNGPLDPEQTQWVALLAAPPGAVLGGLTALRRDGFRTTQTHSLTVIGKHRSRNPGWTNATYWVSRQLSDLDMHRVVGEPPRTAPARSTIDVASRVEGDVRVRGTVLAVVQQQVASPDALTNVVARFPTLPHRALIRESITDAIGGIESVPEHEFDAIRRAWRLPEPSRQTIVERRDGRYFLDTEWLKYRARCEVHGAPHFSVDRWSDDLERQNELVLSGGSMLAFTSFTIRHRQPVVGRQLVSLLRQGGWRG